MANGIVSVPTPVNDPSNSYAPGSPEKASLKAKINEMLGEEIEIPLIIGGKEVRTGNTGKSVCPHDHQHVLATYHKAGEAEVQAAIDAAAEAWKDWSEMPWEHRAAVMLKAAELLQGPWRDRMNAACMLNQSKNAFQAEIDAASELVDFWRFNPHYMRFIYEQQPESAQGYWDYVEYRALEGFVFAVTPFNFASIAGNLPTAPALMGNTVLWKPASSTVFHRLASHEAHARGRLPSPASSTSSPDQAARSGTRSWPAHTSPAFTSPDPLPSSRECGSRSATTSPTTAPIPASSARPAARTSFSPTNQPTSKPSPPRLSGAPSSTRARSVRPRRAHTFRAPSGLR